MNRSRITSLAGPRIAFGEVALKRYQEFPSPFGLEHLIECVWVFAPRACGGKAAIERIFPDGASDIVVSGESAAVHGPAASFRLISEERPILGFRIRRGAAKAVLGFGPADLKGVPITFGTLWGRRGRDFESRIQAISAPVVPIELLAGFVRQRIAEVADLDIAVLAALDRIDRFPGSAIRNIASDVGLSERHLRRRFENHVGLGIKHYARMARFQRLLDAIRQYKRRLGVASPGWAGLSGEHGFADQAHLIREVKTFAGLTPVELLLTL